MKKILLFLLLISSFPIWSQEPDSLRPRPLHVGFQISPDYGYRFLETGADDAWMKEIYDTLEVGRFSYTAGLSAIYNFNKNVSFGSGLLFSDKGERTKNYATPPVNNYTNHYYFLDVPLKVNYTVAYKKINFFITAGIVANVYLSGRTQVKTNSSGSKEVLKPTSEVSPVSFSFTGGIGIDCPLTDRWYFKLEPAYKRSISAATAAPVKKYFYSFGLNLGVFCRI